MLHRLALCWFRLTGWKIEGELPSEPKLILIGAPVLRRFFEGGRGKYPDQASEIRLIEETAGQNGFRAT